MRTKSEHISPAQTLFLQWYALWERAFAFARTVSLAQYRDARGAAEKAEMLEVWSRFALLSLLSQIAALETNGSPNTKDDARYLAHLRAIVGALALLCLLSAKIKRESAGRVNVFASSDSVKRCRRIRALGADLQPIQSPWFLDSG